MGKSFAEKFEEALAEKRRATPGYGLRTLARELADDDKVRTETIRRRLNKYRPRPGGGAAEVRPTDETRRDIERAMGLETDALIADQSVAARAISDQAFLEDLAPFRRLWDISQQLERGELVRVEELQES